jgi:hypothetical protein
MFEKPEIEGEREAKEQTPSLPDASPHAGRPRRSGRKSNFLAGAHRRGKQYGQAIRGGQAIRQAIRGKEIAIRGQIATYNKQIDSARRFEFI